MSERTTEELLKDAEEVANESGGGISIIVQCSDGYWRYLNHDGCTTRHSGRTLDRLLSQDGVELIGGSSTKHFNSGKTVQRKGRSRGCLKQLIAELSVKLRGREGGLRRMQHTVPECNGYTEFYPSDVIAGGFIICNRCQQKVKLPTPPSKD